MVINLKSMLFGVIIGFLISVFLLVFYTYFPDQTIVQTRIKLAKFSNTYVAQQKKEIENKILSKKPINKIHYEYLQEDIDLFEINNNGTIIFSLNKEVMIILSPEVRNGEIVWGCIGRPTRKVSPFCQ